MTIEAAMIEIRERGDDLIHSLDMAFQASAHDDKLLLAERRAAIWQYALSVIVTLTAVRGND